MAQRISGYERVAADAYDTPAWVVGVLGDLLPVAGRRIWEPASGAGKLAAALTKLGAVVFESDIEPRAAGIEKVDFLLAKNKPGHAEGIITNPPYGKQGRLGEAFIAKGLAHVAEERVFLALLLPVDFDSAITRYNLFGGSPYFCAKIVLMRRIKWFEKPPGEKAASPSANHAWFIWQPEPAVGRLGLQLYYGPAA